MKLDFLKPFDFFTGVPDSLLQPLCNYLMATYGVGKHHVIAANEGNAAALAAGYHLATGRVPVVYLQNSGIGNLVNPVASLLNDQVYAIPCLFLVGWRGEPGVPDEPQHRFQGQVTVRLLEDLGIRTMIVDSATPEADVARQLEAWQPEFAAGRQAALIVRKGAFTFDGAVRYQNAYAMTREEILRRVAAVAGEDLLICTTGKASRELFEIREAAGQGHGRDFLTVGSMGHSSSIALGIALQQPERKIWILDGDGAALMHLGAMALLGSNRPARVAHLVLNNGAHETVGGLPTVAESMDWPAIARGCGYPEASRVDTYEALDAALAQAKAAETLTFLEARVALGARSDLGRPTTTARENKDAFMETLRKTETDRH